ncbi:MAG: GNAT family N-acetyltransferase [Desulfitobacterium hafniense]|nr:GNAT family N-acetyltransferase [Desulfitobacterium hafniense]
MQSLKIRIANLSDKEQIERCVNLAYEKYIPRIGKKPKPMLDDYIFLIDKGNVFLGEYEGQLVGILVLKNSEKYIFLDNVAVEPSYQGKGFGKKLLLFAEKYAKEKDIKEIRLYTNAKMFENIAIYKKMGFSEFESKQEDGYDRIYFKKQF